MKDSNILRLLLTLLFVVGSSLALSSCSDMFGGKSGQQFRGDGSDDSIHDPDAGDEYTSEDGDTIKVEDGDDNADTVRITIGEYMETFEPMTITGLRMEDNGTHRGATMSLAIAKIGDKTLTAASRNKSKITVTFPEEGKSVQSGGKLCPSDYKGKITYEMQIQFKGMTANMTSRNMVLGYRPGTKSSSQTLIEVGFAKETGHSFHEIDGVIARLECPQAKSIHVKDLCYDATLDDDFKRCSWYAWRSSQPCYKNWGKDRFTPQCK